jgi:hypothetical protein
MLAVAAISSRFKPWDAKATMRRLVVCGVVASCVSFNFQLQKSDFAKPPSPKENMGLRARAVIHFLTKTFDLPPRV